MAHYFTTAAGRASRDRVLLRDMYGCQMCGVALTDGRTSPRSATVDHTVPTSLWPEGERDEGNMRAVCKRCHDTVCASIEARHAEPETIKRLKLAYIPVGLDGYRAAPQGGVGKFPERSSNKPPGQAFAHIRKTRFRKCLHHRYHLLRQS